MRNHRGAHRFFVGDSINKIGEAIHDHQFIDPQPSRFRHAAHLFHQVGGKLFVIGQTRFAQGDHFGQAGATAAGPKGITTQAHAFFGQNGDFIGKGLAMRIAEFKPCSAHL